MFIQRNLRVNLDVSVTQKLISIVNIAGGVEGNINGRKRMKKGDQVKKIKPLTAGTEIAHNFSTLVRAEEWAKTMDMPLKARPSSEFPNTFHVVLKENYDLVERGLVKWVISDEMSILDKSTGLYHVVAVSDWEVEIEGTPEYQSTVASMSEQQLRDSLDCLRTQRRTAPRVRIKAPGAPRLPRVKEDPMMKALAGMDPVKKQALMEKLGMV